MKRIILFAFEMFSLAAHPIGIKWWTQRWNSLKLSTLMNCVRVQIGIIRNFKCQNIDNISRSATLWTRRNLSQLSNPLRAGSLGPDKPVYAFITTKIFICMAYCTYRDQLAAKDLEKAGVHIHQIKLFEEEFR